jgi:hypothetical protein
MEFFKKGEGEEMAAGYTREARPAIIEAGVTQHVETGD